MTITSNNGKFWRGILGIVIAAAIVGYGAVSWETNTTVIEIKTMLETKIPEIDRRLLALENPRRRGLRRGD